jgi:arylsulfatase A-like enzyme
MRAGRYLIAASGLASAFYAKTQAESRQPNIIFILADDVGWGDLGCYGNRFIKTPNLDRLARNGVMFVHGYANAPVCAPSRTSALTGHYPPEVGFHNIYGKDSADNKQKGLPDFLDPDLPTVARTLQQSGYATAHFGKWHMGGPFNKEAPEPGAYGFDEYISFVSNGPQLREYTNPRRKPGEHPDTHTSEVLADLTIDFIRRNKERPFYINVWSHVAHSLLLPSQEMLEAYPNFVTLGAKNAPLMKKAYGIEGWTNPRQIYYSMLTDLDRHIGRILAELEDVGVAANTLIVFCSDNGPEIDRFAATYHSSAGSTGPFRGRKRSLYEGGIRVPFIASWPIRQKRFNLIDTETILSFADLPATFCAAAGLPWPGRAGNDSNNMLPAFLGEKTVQRNAPIFWLYSQENPSDLPWHKAPLVAVRDGDWKLLANPDRRRVELYHLIRDPGELDNVAREYPDQTERLFSLLTDWIGSLPPGQYGLLAGSNGHEWSQVLDGVPPQKGR